MEDVSRRIKIILDSKAAEGSIGELKKQMREWNKIIEKSEVGSKEYVAALKKIKEAQPILDDHKKNLRGIEDAHKGLWAKANSTIDGVGGLKNAFMAAGVAQFGMEVFQAGKELAKIAFQLEQGAKKAATVFGPALDTVTTAAKRNATAMGLTVSQYVAAATATGDLLIPMGFTRQEAAGMSAEMTNLSGALAEWSDGKTTAKEASDIMTKALLGERDGLQALGIAISKEQVDLRVAQMGMKGLTGAALEQAEAMATLQLITEKSADAQTAHAQNAGSNTRKMAEFDAQIADLTERLATEFLPAFSRILDISVDLLDLFGNIDPAVFSAVFDAIIGPLAQVKTLYDWVSGKKIEAPKVVGGGEDSQDEIAAKKAAAQKLMQAAAKEEARKKEAKKEAEKRAEEAARQRERELKEVETLNKFLKEKRAELAIADETDELARMLAEIDKKYAAQLEKVIAAEAHNIRGAAEARKSLETLINEEKTVAEWDYMFAEVERKAAHMAELTKLEENRLQSELDLIIERGLKQDELDRAAQEKKKAAQLLIAEELMTEEQSEIAKLNAHFTELLQIADEYGLDTTALRKKQAEEIARIEKEGAEKVTKKQSDENKKRLEAQRALFQGLGDLASAAGELFASESGKMNRIQKVATLAQIAIDTASAIASLTKGSEAAGAVAGPLAPIVAAISFATGLARILINIKKAKDLLFSAPEVPQKFEGGWTDVTGQTDGQTYRAKYIGQVGTGLLNQTHPVVLANERGPEYFVDNASLRNPAVLNHVRAIENLKGSVPQFAEGGFSPGGGNMDMMNAMMSQMLSMLGLLNARLSQPLFAVIEDRTITDMAYRSQKISTAAGGSVQFS